MAGLELYRRWLLAFGLGLAAFGTAMAVLSGTAAFDPINRLLDPAFWGAATPVPPAQDFRAWVYGVWGASLAGWGLTIAFLAAEPFRRREPWAWRALAAGTATWFVLDTALSIGHGVAANVALNVAILVVVAVPLLRTRGAFR